MGKLSREKGKAGEREVCSMLRDIYPFVRTKRAGGESASVDRGRDLLGTPGMCPQVKVHNFPPYRAALDEAKEAAGDDELPIAFIKQSHHSWTVIMEAHHFMAIYKLAIGRVVADGQKNHPLIRRV